MKTKEEFNLSEKIFHMKRTLNLKTKEKEDFDFVKKEDVKEFIRLCEDDSEEINGKSYIRISKMQKLAGEKLK